MKRIAILGMISMIGLAVLLAQPSEYQAVRTEAEKYYAEGSYARAHEVYLKADAMELPPAEARWVEFRLADTLWRSQASTETADATKFEEAQHRLEVLVRDIQRVEDRDRVWAEVQESLGDFFWTRRDSRNFGQAWTHYQQALDWWAGSTDIEMARKRYLKIVWTVARPPWVEPYYYYGYHGNWVPLEILQNALKIATSENDKAHAHYLIAMTLRHQGSEMQQRQRIPEEFEAALKAGKATEWYDDALYFYAEWLAGSGRIIPLENGQWRQEPDYVKALELFRRLLSEHVKGESRFYDQAKQQVENITKPVVGVTVSNIFLPDSEIEFHLSWRNVKRIDLALYRVDLTHDVQFLNKDAGSNTWLEQIKLAQPLKTWTKDTQDKGDYKPGQEKMHLDEKLKVGAYILEAGHSTARARDIILVTDAALVLKTSRKQALAYFCSATNGSPIASASIRFWERSHNGQTYVWRDSLRQTNQDGIAVLELSETRSNTELFVAASTGDRQAYSIGYNYGYYREFLPWRIYAFTDRPAYRPEDEVQWKFIARQYNGSIYSTPSNQIIEFEIYDPRGSKVKQDTVTLNAFGSAWGSLKLDTSMPLGEYRIQFWDQGRKNSIGSANLFRLEEYKLPEFKVSIQTPEENGKKKAFRLGESVEVNVQADYYFGGAVSNASVELLVYQNVFYHRWRPPRDYPWLYEDINGSSSRYWDTQGQIIKRETLRTDATGKATITFETPRNSQQDYEYRIEARVTDASRREITGSSKVRVTRQRYYVYPNPEHYVYRPQDKVTINIKSIDANDQPVAVEGMVKVTRDYWFEIWIDPSGKEVKGEELKAWREKTEIFPPPAPPGGKPWRLKFQGYEHDEILTRPVKTDAKGEAVFEFVPERDGYYRISWISKDRDSATVHAESTVWVVTNETTELGYRHGGLEIIVDKDTFRAGQKAPVLLSVPTSDRYVLFTVEGDDFYNYSLVHVAGTVKLVELPVEDKFVPNVFLGGAMVSDRQLFVDTKQVVVPPVEHFVDVEVKADREQYQPREEGTLTVSTRDHNGKPVSAEVGLALVDESVFYIQQDYAGDPRQYYFGEKRPQQIQMQSTFQQKSYKKLIEGKDEALIDERKRLSEEQAADLEALGYVGEAAQVRGGVAAARIAAVPTARDAFAVAKSAEMRMDVFDESPAAAPPPPPGEPVVVRTDFRATVFWQPNVITNNQGVATVKVKYPDSLTSWKTTARVVTQGSQFGIGTASTRTKKPLIVRLQAPRFFVVGDTVTISAVINNNTDGAMNVTTVLDALGLQAQSTGNSSRSVAASAEARVDWVATVSQPGEVKLRITARGGKYSDAMEKNYVAFEHGIEKFEAKSGKVRGDDVRVSIHIPKERKPESTTLTVQVTPSMAVTMLDALPYLINYPYGCTEQTMSRFLPSVITAKTLRDLGLKGEIEGRIFGGIEQQHTGKTHPEGKKDLGKLDEMVKAGLARLYDFQHSDGGWGWWKEGESDHFMTAYVVWGFSLAQNAGVQIRSDSLSRGVDYLQKEMVEEEEHYDEQAWMLHALAFYRAFEKQKAGPFEAKGFENLWTNRDRLNAYTRALLALSAHYYGYREQATTLIRNLENGVKIDNAPDTSIIIEKPQQTSDAVMGTAHWGEDGIYWRWSEGGVEATSFALRAFLAIDPQNKLIEPVTNWLIKNRRGAQWSNTRDTAITVLTLNDYLRQSGELNPQIEYELLVNGNAVASKKITAEDVFSAPSQFPIEQKYIQDGNNEIRIRRKSGSGPIYFAAHAKFFSLEEPVSAAGSEIFVRRQYYRLAGKPTLLKGYVYDRLPLNDGEAVTSGDRVEVVLTIEAKNNYEYLVFEDLKPAGLEAVEVRSGESLFAQELKQNATGDFTGRTRWVYQELRDRKVALFIDKLPQGFWQIRYDLRAEVPGKFHALPVLGFAMYVPEIRANSAEIRIRVEDKQ